MSNKFSWKSPIYQQVSTSVNRVPITKMIYQTKLTGPPSLEEFSSLKKIAPRWHHIGSVDRQSLRIAYVFFNRWHLRSTGVRTNGRLGIHEGGQRVWGKKDAGIKFSVGVNTGISETWLRTALERVVTTLSRTARLELTKALDAGKNWQWFQFGREVDWWINLWS